MEPRPITQNIFAVGAVDWDRRLFDALIPLPDGTSYNAYLVRGSEKTALIDTVDPALVDVLMAQLEGVETIDYIVSNHTEQDHSGAIGRVLEKYPGARVLASAKGVPMLADHLGLSPESMAAVADGEEVSLGDTTLRFIATPWVHWPETMSTYIPESRILFSCDFFGSHIASSDLFVTDHALVYEAAKRYYAEIMMPFRSIIRKHLEKLAPLAIDIIAPSHGACYSDPSFIVNAYHDWVSEEPKNLVVVPYVSMHGSTRKLVDRLVGGLARRGVKVQQFELASTDIGKLAIALVDAATLIVGTPTVHVGPHPAAVYAAYLANALRPRVRYASVVGSYGWTSKAGEKIAELLPNLKVELLPGVLCKGDPREADLAQIDALSDTVARLHRDAGFAPITEPCAGG